MRNGSDIKKLFNKPGAFSRYKLLKHEAVLLLCMCHHLKIL